MTYPCLAHKRYTTLLDQAFQLGIWDPERDLFQSLFRSVGPCRIQPGAYILNGSLRTLDNKSQDIQRIGRGSASRCR